MTAPPPQASPSLRDTAGTNGATAINVKEATTTSNGSSINVSIGPGATTSSQPKDHDDATLDSPADPAYKPEEKGWLEWAAGGVRQLLGWVPLIVGLSITDYRIAVTAAFGMALVTIAYDYTWFRMGKTKVFPTTLSCIFAVMFGALTGLMWADDERSDDYLAWSGVMTNGGIVLGIGVAWAFGHPFVLDYMIDRFPEKRTLTHPLMRHIIRVMTLGWMAVFLGMLLISLVGGLAPSAWAESRLFVLAFQFPGFMTFVILTIGFIFNAWYPSHFMRNWEKLEVVYEKACMEWYEKNPDHEWSKKMADALEDGAKASAGHSTPAGAAQNM